MTNILELVAWSYLFFVIGGLAIILTLIHMLYTKRSPTSILVWLLLMIIAPYIFVIFYFIFGVRKYNNNNLTSLIDPKQIKKSTNLDQFLQNNLINPSSSNNMMQIYTDSSIARREFFQSLKGAKESIYISTYIFKYDTTGKEVLQILHQKAKEGVDVKVITDALGSFWLHLFGFHLKSYAHKNLEFRFFKPLLTFAWNNRLNLRNHRKIYIIDQTTLFSGGMNIADEYLGKNKENRWIDIMYEVRGDIVKDYLEIFVSDYHQSAQKRFDFQKKEQKNYGSSVLQAVPSGPNLKSDALFEAILYSIYNAKKNITIVTPYFIPDEQILQGLKVAFHKGIELKIITPQHSNHLFADITRSSYIRQLQEWGVETIFYKGAMLHAKAMIFDNEVLILGSINLDYRSLLLNYEAVTISYSQTDIEHMNIWVQSLLQNSTKEFSNAGKIRKVFENSTRIFASQL